MWTIAWTGLARYLTCTLSTRPLLLKPSSLAPYHHHLHLNCQGATGYCFNGNCPTTGKQCQVSQQPGLILIEKKQPFKVYELSYGLIFYLHQDLWGHGAEPGENECFVHYNLKGTAQVCDKLPKNTAFTNTHKIQILNSGQLWGEQVQVWRGQRVPEMFTRVIFL